MRKKNSKLRLTLDDICDEEKVINYLDEHFTKGQIFETLCFNELVIAEEVPWRTTKKELLEKYWEDLSDIYIQTGDIEIDE